MSENEYLRVMLLSLNAKIDTLIRCVAAMHRGNSTSPKMQEAVKNFYDEEMSRLESALQKILKDFGAEGNKD